MIYCKDCAFFYEFSCEYGSSRRCLLDDKTDYEYPVRPQKIFGTEKQLEKRNKDNNCPDFKRISTLGKIVRGIL